MNIVFLTRTYYPYFSAVSKCIFNIAEVLSEKHNVKIITTTQKADDKSELSLNKQSIYRIEPWKKTFFEKTLKTSSLSDRMVKKYASKLEDFQDIDVIIPTCFPFETVIAALDCKKKKKNIKVFPILFDGFMENNYLYKNIFARYMRYNGNKTLEERMFKESDYIFHTTNWNSDIQTNWYQYANHCKEVEHPLVIRQDSPIVAPKKLSPLTLTYTGSLDIQSRDPESVLSFLTLALNKTDSKIVICGRSTGDKIVNAYKEKYPSLIVKYPKVSTEKAEQIRNESDFLFCLGNTKTRYLQSKIFDYISSGKPIIHFASGPDDITIEVLKPYKNHCIIDLKSSTFEKEKEKLLLFLYNNRNIQVPFNIIESTYYKCTPDYIASLIETNF